MPRRRDSGHSIADDTPRKRGRPTFVITKDGVKQPRSAFIAVETEKYRADCVALLPMVAKRLEQLIQSPNDNTAIKACALVAAVVPEQLNIQHDASPDTWVALVRKMQAAKAAVQADEEAITVPAITVEPAHSEHTQKAEPTQVTDKSK